MFYGRREELRKLNGLLGKKTASLVVVSGRRRIGKSTLIQEFSKKFDFFVRFRALHQEILSQIQISVKISVNR